jgi:hypothetical protein
MEASSSVTVIKYQQNTSVLVIVLTYTFWLARIVSYFSPAAQKNKFSNTIKYYHIKTHNLYSEKLKNGNINAIKI